MLNDALYENYLTMTRYYDDDFEKTAAFIDCMSLDETNEAYIGRQQDYSMRSFSYLPAACLKVNSNQEHKFVKKFEYPKTFRSLNFDKKRNVEVLNTLLDMKAKMSKNEEKAAEAADALPAERVHGN